MGISVRKEGEVRVPKRPNLKNGPIGARDDKKGDTVCIEGSPH
jgi:hypothetical protein